MPPPDPVLVAAYSAQAELTAVWLAGLTDDDLAAPSRLVGWTVGALASHVAASGRTFVDALAAPQLRGAKSLSLAAYVAGYGPDAEAIDARARAAAEGLTVDAARAEFVAGADSVLAGAQELSNDPVVAAARGPVRASDLLRTRVLELVVHSLDVEGGPALDRQAVRVCVRALAAILAERHGGKAIEVRVPPYAAVQVGAGVTHTRGTPPNVVECAPETFVAIASGRRPWAEAMAAGDIRASGSRADLTPYLPLL